ncbi:hypothetical protein [Phytohabitans houttuyneae]|uniref:Uncharacterized protein n=1 Tax=Phytohabitans houttuyneae TaxID=1076126 RepID=A0A6V8KMN7_9ACTN|nr:hypothetical protein [Phytohabitans houttuyneae]GFJ83489.1 hypothetical protein Phou_076690 [Phytohabitans houttuyneae]
MLGSLGSRRARGPDEVYARAVPKTVEVTETYAVKQDISHNKSSEPEGEGTGRIEVTVPYDGDKHFSHRAAADVAHALGTRGAAADRRAVIGQLLVAAHDRTSGLPAVMRHHHQAGVIPLTVPVATPDGSLDLTGDRRTCVVTHDYQPLPPHLLPVDLEVRVFDPDSLTDELDAVRQAFDNTGLLANARPRAPQKTSDAINRLRQTARFSSELLLYFSVRVVLPVKANYPALHPVVREMSIQWPTRTSLRSTRLLVENLGPDAREHPFKDGAVRYNPVPRQLEWADVATREVTPSDVRRDEDGTRVFRSAMAMLYIGHPGDLFKEELLEIDAVVEIPGYLMSGLEARLYGATGHRLPDQPELTTKLRLHAKVYPSDIFAMRRFSPYQQFVFDDIMPDEMRINDLVTVLRNAKFSVDKPQAEPDAVHPTWLLKARRSQGPDELELVIAVEGRRIDLDREQILGTSVKIKGRKESGQLKISVLGNLERDHKELTRVMNAVQRELRDRFRFHQLSGK